MFQIFSSAGSDLNLYAFGQNLDKLLGGLIQKWPEATVSKTLCDAVQNRRKMRDILTGKSAKFRPLVPSGGSHYVVQTSEKILFLDRIRIPKRQGHPYLRSRNRSSVSCVTRTCMGPSCWPFFKRMRSLATTSSSRRRAAISWITSTRCSTATSPPTWTSSRTARRRLFTMAMQRTTSARTRCTAFHRTTFGASAGRHSETLSAKSVQYRAH